MIETLNVFSAGVALAVATQAAERWNERRPDFPVKLEKGGSVVGVKSLLAGEPYDLLILADDSLIEAALSPKATSGYAVFAGNKMAVAASPGRSIDSSDWLVKLTDPKAVFAHFDPKADPGGYRAILAMTLADHYEKGLSAKLLDHPGRLCLEKPGPPGSGPKFDYFFCYYSMAKSKGLSFAELPKVMDLSDDSLAEVYATAEFRIDEALTILGAPIAHALTIPRRAPHPQLAYEFAQEFLASDFAAFNFTPRAKAVGALLDPGKGQ
ncbi:MAG: substrate-binding domain-containing protein [Deltaproteobacteria bacterium]|jgi:ABC-type molybdate transport system substrate-binding protein|nr:substrate-binding domain-containing protein [Deltaproteobacteria bacterium]